MTTIPSYWQGTGRYQAAANALLKLIPHKGACANVKTVNRHLDRFRRAANCYYDLFNNGLCNRGADFRSLFKVGRLPRKQGRLDFRQIEADGKVEARMDELALTAAKEQRVVLE